MRTHWYIAGPMSGLPKDNRPAFAEAAAKLRGLGYDVISPAELNPLPAGTYEECMRRDIRALMTYCQGVVLLPGWAESRGASSERFIAELVGMELVDLDVMLAHPRPIGCGHDATEHAHYKKDVRHIDMLDVYRLLDLFAVTHPCPQHAVKKLLVAGGRGAKDTDKDIQEAIDTLVRWQGMRAEDAGKAVL
jgi:hypothetical protein